MVFYSFYTTRERVPDSLVYRTLEVEREFNEDEEFNFACSPLQINLKLFDDKDQAQKDFFKILWHNEDFRIGEYFDTDKKSKVSSTKKTKSDKPLVVYEHSGVNIERNKVYNESCEQTMKNMPNNFVDYVITSPPYNVGSGLRNDDGDGLYAEYSDDLSQTKYREWIFNVTDELLRVTRKHVFFNIQMLGDNKTTVLLFLGRYAFKIKDIIIWKKTIVPPHIQPGIMNSAWEFIIVLSNDEPQLKKFNDARFSQGTLNNLFEGMNASQNKHASLNKATFPLYLPRKIMINFCAKGSLVYDPFMGTGTTAEAAVMEGIDFIGSELDSKQCDIVNNRVKERESKLEIFEKD